MKNSVVVLVVMLIGVVGTASASHIAGILPVRMPGAVSAQVGDPNDLLTVFQGDGDGSPLHSWLWKKSETGGLVDAGMPLFQQIRNAVDAACVQPPTRP